VADELIKRVVIIDTSNEIAGDGDIPHQRLVELEDASSSPELQHQVMIEAVENHMQKSSSLMKLARNWKQWLLVRLPSAVYSVVPLTVTNLIKNQLSDLVGGIQAVTLGDEEAKVGAVRRQF